MRRGRISTGDSRLRLVGSLDRSTTVPTVFFAKRPECFGISCESAHCFPRSMTSTFPGALFAFHCFHILRWLHSSATISIGVLQVAALFSSCRAFFLGARENCNCTFTTNYRLITASYPKRWDYQGLFSFCGLVSSREKLRIRSL